MEAIYAIDLKNGISKNGLIPWKSKKDMLFFMNKTKNNVVIMGKNTWLSLPENNRPLKNRLNIVLTSCPDDYKEIYLLHQENVIFTNNDNLYKDILINRYQYYSKYFFLDKEYKIFFIGGVNVYKKCIPLCDKVWVTQIKSEYNCDLFLDYNYSNQFTEEIFEEDDELRIIQYNRL